MLEHSTLRWFFLRSVDKTHLDVLNVKQLKNVCSKFNHLSHINYPDTPWCRCFLVIAEIDIKKGPVRSPFAIRNLLGWTITGPRSSKYLDKKPRKQQTNDIDARNREQPTLSKANKSKNSEKLTTLPYLLIFLPAQIQERSKNYLNSWKTKFNTMEQRAT